MSDKEAINQAISAHDQAWAKIQSIGIDRLGKIADKYQERFLREDDEEARIIATVLYVVSGDLRFAEQFPDAHL